MSHDDEARRTGEGGLVVEGLSYAYGAKQALSDVSFAAEPGRFTALLGPNGAGKSTLFSLIVRLFEAPKGRISIDGADLAKAPLRALSRLGVVFQQPTLDLDLSVRANMRYFAALHGLSGREADRRINEALARLDMAERAEEKARSLNGGHRRRMEIARALLHQPDVFVFDEPTVGLDAPTRAAIVAHVHKLAEEGAAVLWATHLVDEVSPGDDVLVLHQGRLVAAGAAGEIAGRGTLAEAFAALTAKAAA